MARTVADMEAIFFVSVRVPKGASGDGLRERFTSQRMEPSSILQLLTFE
jgi:hypothetical protein